MTAPRARGAGAGTGAGSALPAEGAATAIAPAKAAPSATRLRRAERKEACRAAILEAARLVFFRDGFMPANLDEVAERAQVAKGTLYRYFDSKAELYVAVLARDGRLFEQKMRATIDPALDPLDQIRRTARFYYQHWTDNPEYFAIFWALDNQSVIGELPDAVVEEVTKLWEGCLRVLADVIARGVKEGRFAPCDSWEIANVLWTLANGLLQSDLAPSRRRLRRRRLDRVFEHAIEIVLRGLAAPTASTA
jgi:AcrR family transcriptional regulator